MAVNATLTAPGFTDAQTAVGGTAVVHVWEQEDFEGQVVLQARFSDEGADAWRDVSVIEKNSSKALDIGETCDVRLVVKEGGFGRGAVYLRIA